jgi:hypothetical protein
MSAHETAPRAQRKKQMDQLRSYVPDPRLQHRDQTLINLEHKVAALWKRGLAPSAIAFQLGLPVATITAVIARCAPAVKTK